MKTVGIFRVAPPISNARDLTASFCGYPRVLEHQSKFVRSSALLCFSSLPSCSERNVTLLGGVKTPIDDPYNVGVVLTLVFALPYFGQFSLVDVLRLHY